MEDLSKIRDIDKFMQSAIDWGLFAGCFGPKENNVPSDIDGLMDKNNQWLLIEKKYYGGLTEGQEIKFKKYWKETKTHAVMIIYGTEKQPTSIEIWQAGSDEIYRFPSATHELLRKLFKVWYAAAERYESADFGQAFQDHIKEMQEAYALSVSYAA